MSQPYASDMMLSKPPPAKQGKAYINRHTILLFLQFAFLAVEYLRGDLKEDTKEKVTQSRWYLLFPLTSALVGIGFELFSRHRVKGHKIPINMYLIGFEVGVIVICILRWMLASDPWEFPNLPF